MTAHPVDPVQLTARDALGDLSARLDTIAGAALRAMSAASPENAF